MGDTANWEFAAAVASVVMGLGGLLVFTLFGTIGSWIVLGRASRAATEAANANLSMQDLAREIAMREAMPRPAAEVSQALREINALRAQADMVTTQQARLQETVRQMTDASVQVTQLEDLRAAVKRLEDNLAQMAATVANLAQRQS